MGSTSCLAGVHSVLLDLLALRALISLLDRNLLAPAFVTDDSVHPLIFAERWGGCLRMLSVCLLLHDREKKAPRLTPRLSFGTQL